MPPEAVHSLQNAEPIRATFVQGSVSTFAAIVGDGSIVAWGDRRPVAESSTKNLRRT